MGRVSRSWVGVSLIAVAGCLLVVATFLPWISAIKSSVEGDPKFVAELQCAQQLGIPLDSLVPSGPASPAQRTAFERCVRARAGRGFPKDLYRVREYSGWQLAQRCHPDFVDDRYFSSFVPGVCKVPVEEDTQPVPTGVWTLAIGTGLLAVAGLVAIATRTSSTWARRTLLGLSVLAAVFAVLFALVLWAFATALYQWPRTHAAYASVGFGHVQAGVVLVVIGCAVALSGAVVACWPHRRPPEQARTLATLP